MAAKAWSTQQKTVEEIFFQNDAVSLCLVVNRRIRMMRVVDFRAGPSDAKRLLVLSLGQREGVEKAYTLVERDEVSTWVKLGFTKEGNIPGFYKRSDAFLLGCTIPGPGRAKALERAPVTDDDDVPSRSEMRLTAAASSGSAPLTPAQALMERTIVAAKKAVKEFSDKAVPNAKIAPVGEAESRKAVAAALKNGRALTAFEPFGRDAERRSFTVTARGGFELHASIESQACFGNAFLELLQSPRNDAEMLATAGAVRAFCDRLLAEDVVSCFSLAPSDDLALAKAYIHNGFRRTGLLNGHMMVGNQRKDAIVWARKLANPTDE